MTIHSVKLQKNYSQPTDTPWEGDKLSRQSVADYLTPVIASIRQPFVIGISSPYGTGKTFFIQNWQKSLKADKYCTAYFNAWETDYSENPLIAFISAIKSDLEKSKDETESKKAPKLVELAKKGGVYLTKKAIPVIAKGVVRNFIGDDGVNQLVDFSPDTENQISEVFGSMAEDALRQHEAIQSSIESFKTYLEEFVKETTKDKDSEDKKKLIIFVDELDRCRPTYAIEVLECIKHLFNVPGVVFIIAVDEEQLRSSIAAVYGLRLDGEGYLKKFIDWRIRLPEPKSKEYANYLFDYFDLGGTQKFSHSSVHNGRESLINAFSLFSDAFKLTLRQQAHCFTDINISIRAMSASNSSPLAQTLGVVAVLREVYPLEIKSYCLGERPIDKLLENFDSMFGNKPILFNSFYGSWKRFRAVLHVMFLNEEKFRQRVQGADELQRKLHTITGAGNASQDAEKRALEQELDYITELHRAYEHYQLSYYSHSTADTVYRRLERASNLNVEGL